MKLSKISKNCKSTIIGGAIIAGWVAIMPFLPKQPLVDVNYLSNPMVDDNGISRNAGIRNLQQTTCCRAPDGSIHFATGGGKIVKDGQIVDGVRFSVKPVPGAADMSEVLFKDVKSGDSAVTKVLDCDSRK